MYRSCAYRISIANPPKYSVSEVVGFIKGRSAIAIARDVQGRARNFVWQSFWERGHVVSTVDRDETVNSEYIRNQEAGDRRIDQLITSEPTAVKPFRSKASSP